MAAFAVSTEGIPNVDYSIPGFGLEIKAKLSDAIEGVGGLAYGWVTASGDLEARSSLPGATFHTTAVSAGVHAWMTDTMGLRLVGEYQTVIAAQNPGEGMGSTHDGYFALRIGFHAGVN